MAFVLFYCSWAFEWMGRLCYENIEPISDVRRLGELEPYAGIGCWAGDENVGDLIMHSAAVRMNRISCVIDATTLDTLATVDRRQYNKHTTKRQKEKDRKNWILHFISMNTNPLCRCGMYRSALLVAMMKYVMLYVNWICIYRRTTTPAEWNMKQWTRTTRMSYPIVEPHTQNYLLVAFIRATSTCINCDVDDDDRIRMTCARLFCAEFVSIHWILLFSLSFNFIFSQSCDFSAPHVFVPYILTLPIISFIFSLIWHL